MIEVCTNENAKTVRLHRLAFFVRPKALVEHMRSGDLQESLFSLKWVVPVGCGAACNVSSRHVWRAWVRN